ncbi:MAG TPA: hypothetical protein VKV26_11385 [Dehalococcoidia bacterium]|nr:hypothetical protein [Dehalococcoidia bacterium]
MNRAQLNQRLAKLEAKTQQALAVASAPKWHRVLTACGGSLYAAWNISGCAGFEGEWKPPMQRSDEEIDAGVVWYLNQREACIEPPSRPPEEARARHVDRQVTLLIAYLMAHGVLPLPPPRQPCVLWRGVAGEDFRSKGWVVFGQLGDAPAEGECTMCPCAPSEEMREAALRWFDEQNQEQAA